MNMAKFLDSVARVKRFAAEDFLLETEALPEFWDRPAVVFEYDRQCEIDHCRELLRREYAC